MADYSSYINQAALKYGISSSYLTATVGMEGTPNNLFGFQGGAAQAYGFTSPGDFLDIGKQFDSGAAYAKSNAMALQTKLGRAPTDFETYLAHWQGSAGAFNILTNPNAPAQDTVQNYWNNGGASLGSGATNADWIQAAEKRWVNNGGTLGAMDTSGSILGNVGAAVMGGLNSGSATGGAATTTSQTAAGAGGAGSAAKAGTSVAGTSVAGSDVSWGDFAVHQGLRGGVFVLGLVFIGMGLVVFTLGGARANVATYREYRRARSVAQAGGKATGEAIRPRAEVFRSAPRRRGGSGGGGGGGSSNAPAPRPRPNPQGPTGPSAMSQMGGAKPHSGSHSMRKLRAVVKRHTDA